MREFVGYGCSDDMLILKPIIISCSLLLALGEDVKISRGTAIHQLWTSVYGLTCAHGRY